MIGYPQRNLYEYLNILYTFRNAQGSINNKVKVNKDSRTHLFFIIVVTRGRLAHSCGSFINCDVTG